MRPCRGSRAAPCLLGPQSAAGQLLRLRLLAAVPPPADLHATSLACCQGGTWRPVESRLASLRLRKVKGWRSIGGGGGSAAACAATGSLGRWPLLDMDCLWDASPVPQQRVWQPWQAAAADRAKCRDPSLLIHSVGRHGCRWNACPVPQQRVQPGPVRARGPSVGERPRRGNTRKGDTHRAPADPGSESRSGTRSRDPASMTSR